MYCLFVIILYVIFEFGLCLFFFVIDNCGYGNDWVVMIGYMYMIVFFWKYELNKYNVYCELKKYGYCDIIMMNIFICNFIVLGNICKWWIMLWDVVLE